MFFKGHNLLSALDNVRGIATIKKVMKNKNLVIFLVIGLIALVGAGALILSSGKKAAPVEIAQTPVEETVSLMKPEDIGLSLIASADNKKVIFEVANTEGIVGLDYELSYTSKGDIPRGAIGHMDIKQDGRLVKQEIPLGTCSDVCHYDEGVSDIKLILRVTKTDGSTSQIEESLDL